MNDPLAKWETAIIIGGLRVLSILTFVAFFLLAVWHLAKMIL